MTDLMQRSLEAMVDRRNNRKLAGVGYWHISTPPTLDEDKERVWRVTSSY